ncbi:glycoside hydrolase family 130 protein [candidate division KSB1 bacterium]|nr:glycoside hydrolase family 130 protein [candidate division KSB1 bacterium]RQW10168.1 MAG: glycosidase [candidate division KSB1 bacterium]
MSKIIRNPNNPILTTKDLQPTFDDSRVVGVLNPGACKFGDDYILVARVAESCVQQDGWYRAPFMSFDGEKPVLKTSCWKTAEIDLSDPRKFRFGSQSYLSSISHLRLARSKDGLHFTFDPEPFMAAEYPDEAFGIEDARITRIESTYYLTYTAISKDSHGVKLAATTDFVNIKRYGMMLPPENKDTCLFPEKINGKYIALHRPFTDHFNLPGIWYCESPDLNHWGNHSCILRPDANNIESKKIGAGPEPLKTENGWLLLYHSADDNSVYTLHLCLLDLDDPRVVLKRTREPILIPQAPWEKEGFFPNVVFSNGWIKEDDGRVLIYYGAADDSICLAETTIDDLLSCLD